MEAAAELRAVLLQRMQISERGSPSDTSDRAAGHHVRPGTRSAGNLATARSTGAAHPSARRPLRSLGQTARASPRGATRGGGIKHGMEQKLSQLTARGEQLTQDVLAMKARSSPEPTNFLSAEREQLVAHSEQLVAHSDHFRRQQLAEQEQAVKEFRAMRAERAEQDSRIKELTELVAALREEKEALAASLLEARRAQPQAPEPGRSPSPPSVHLHNGSSCSGCRLRGIMVSQSAMPSDLRPAITAVEAFLEEARRELSNKELRQRRAAFEQLHKAMDHQGDDEESLDAAIGVAREAGVHAEDIAAAEKKLADLRALSPEERARRALRELETARKKEAYLLVKKDDAVGLADFLDRLEEGMQWQTWKNYAGKTLRRFAQDLRATRAEAVVVERINATKPVTPLDRSRAAMHEVHRMVRTRSSSSAGSFAADAEVKPATASSSFSEGHVAVPAAAPAVEQPEVFRYLSPRRESVDREAEDEGCASYTPRADEDGARDIEAPSPEEADKLKARALRAVVQDDCASLLEVLESVPFDIWSKWENRAGKDLLTLSQERGSSSAYSALAGALGMIKEVKREAFEERETVWVFVPGDVQPRRATVLEDTPEEADSILVEYWDGDEDPEHVDRCIVRKMWS